VSRHHTVPVFVPHAGCPHTCSFCNQKAISGTRVPPTPRQAAATFAAARESLGERVHSAQLAFFGGSFTAVEEKYRTALLEAAQPFLGEGGFSGIRISTRPDCIDEQVLRQLSRYRVDTIELGVQSLSDAVLAANCRGHTAADVARASRLIREHGFSLGHQMMTGLYRDDDAGAIETARGIIALRPDTVRIYPTVVLRDTILARLWAEGEYTPQTLDQAVGLGAVLLELFAKAGIPVIRLGLQDETGLTGEILSGPHHPALRELCEGRFMLMQALGQIDARGIPKGPVRLRVHPRSVSKMVGQKRRNLLELARRGYAANITPDDGVAPLEVQVEQSTHNQ